MFHKGQAVTVPLNGKPIIGSIVRKQGAHGYMVRIPWKSSHQDRITLEVKTVDTVKDGFWKTSDISIAQATESSA